MRGASRSCAVRSPTRASVRCSVSVGVMAPRVFSPSLARTRPKAQRSRWWDSPTSPHCTCGCSHTAGSASTGRCSRSCSACLARPVRGCSICSSPGGPHRHSTAQRLTCAAAPRDRCSVATCRCSRGFSAPPSCRHSMERCCCSRIRASVPTGSTACGRTCRSRACLRGCAASCSGHSPPARSGMRATRAQRSCASSRRARVCRAPPAFRSGTAMSTSRCRSGCGCGSMPMPRGSRSSRRP